MFTSIVGNVFRFKALRALRLKDLRIPATYAKTFQGSPHGIQVERDKLNKYGRPLLGCTIKPKLGLSVKNYGRVVYEVLRGGLDLTKDDENVSSQPFMCWRNRFLFCTEAIDKAQAKTAKALRTSGGDHIHYGIVVGKLKGEREIILGFVDLLRDDLIEKDQTRSIYFTQDWVSLLGVLPMASGGIHVWHMPALTEIFEDDSILQFGRGTLRHPWSNAPGVVANQVALEACVQARNERCDLAREGNEIIHEACKWNPELAAVCEVWKEIKFEFEAMDTL
ncbi:hypothetical protein GIB67_009489 [Kingdonia uniflora]|uniref:Ribulose bisphosphate carboxylase large chain n=1 Tax=Kingdonia uniflora TaxID=39325 RepID=A0A7J7N3K1_9MAGN|nr:hypothetical protein GIB67_009489 [Kingdonia uniflora]